MCETTGCMNEKEQTYTGTRPKTLKDAHEERRRAAQLDGAIDGSIDGSGDNGAIKLSFYNLFWIFVVASFFGLIIETLVSYPIDGIWKDRAGFVWGPFSPIYGVGGVLMTVGLNGMRGKTAIHTFVFAALLGGAFEFFVGWVLEEGFGIVAWSYLDQPFNLMGHTCLGIALVWGALGIIWVRMLLPLVMDLISLIPPIAAKGLTTVCALFMAANIVLTIGAFNCWFERSAGIPVETPVQAFFADNFGDDFMRQRFQTMSLYPELVNRDVSVTSTED